jgi:ribosomal protein L7/L12
VTTIRIKAVADLVLYTAVAAFGLARFWSLRGSDGPASVALEVLGLVVGLAGALAAIRGLLRLLRPGKLEQVEHDKWLRASARYREPGPYRVVLESAGPRKIDVIKAIREVSEPDLARARTAAEATTPTLLLRDVSAASAGRVTERFGRIGASVLVEEGRPGPTAAPSP